VSRTVDGHAGHKVPRVSGGWRVSPLFRAKPVRLPQTTTTSEPHRSGRFKLPHRNYLPVRPSCTEACSLPCAKRRRYLRLHGRLQRRQSVTKQTILPMRKNIEAIVAIALFCAPVTSIAEFVPPPGVDCSNTDATEYDYNCPPLWAERADKKLNEVYRKLLAALTKEEAQKLRASQRAWIAFRDADVALVVAHSGEGGSLGRSIAAMRSFELTRERVKDLELRLADPQKW
jgi:uncharacterized protein YecT (DUF1311 family)